MTTFPTWMALLILVPLAAAFARREDRPIALLDWASIALVVCGVGYALATTPGPFLEALTLMGVVLAWFAALILLAALVEAAPAALRRAARSARPRPASARVPRAARVTGGTRASEAR
jgi:hypothetical protein